jgi:Uncharacterized protein conserved in bacteria
MEDIKVVSKITSITQKKYQVYMNEQFAFTLYKGELSHYGLREGVSVTQELYQEIESMLLKRAKKRSLHLLNTRSYTQKQLSDKLKMNGYSDKIILQAIDYVESFGYINDKAYVEQYIATQKGRRSMREIREKLRQKGIERQRLEDFFEAMEDEQDDTDAIKSILQKKKYAPCEASVEEKRRIYAYLARKGFRYEDINKVLQVSDGNT